MRVCHLDTPFTNVLVNNLLRSNERNLLENAMSLTRDIPEGGYYRGMPTKMKTYWDAHAARHTHRVLFVAEPTDEEVLSRLTVGDPYLLSFLREPSQELQLAAVAASISAYSNIYAPTPAARALHRLLYGAGYE